MPAKHKVVSITATWSCVSWCFRTRASTGVKAANLLSLLPEDSKARKATRNPSKRALQNCPTWKKLKPYSDELFKEVAIQRLIETDQIGLIASKLCICRPILILAYSGIWPYLVSDQIAIAARATRGVNIPNRKQTPKHIVASLKEQMNALLERFNVSCSARLILN